MGKKRTPYSLRKILAVMLAVLIPISVGGIVFILHTVRNTQRQDTKALWASVESQVEQADTTLKILNSYLVDVLLNDVYVEQIRQATTVSQRNVAARELISQFDYDDMFWQTSVSFAFFVPSKNMVFSRFSGDFPYNENSALRTGFQRQIEEGTLQFSGVNWNSVRQGDNVYLYQIYQADGVYLAAWISCQALFSDIQSNSLSPQGAIYYIVPGESTDSLGEAGLSQEFSPSHGKIILLVTDEPYLEWGQFSMMIGFVVFILLVVLTVTVYTLCYYRRHIRRPLEDFIHHVGECTAGRKIVKKAGIQELNEAVEAFDDLSQQIKQLRIDLYEEKLALAQTEMEYYQLQIKPHFFVNCFSLIHAMAQKQEYQRIQEFCIKLSNYVRYLFSKSLSLVPLERELSMIREFLDIQRIRHRVDAQLQEDAAGVDKNLPIPPLSLLTFVENSVKHGGAKNISIGIKMEMLQGEGKDRLRISVQDTGVGFPPETLEAFSDPNFVQTEDGHHVGIRNIEKRLYFLYGEQYSLRFENNQTGGLVILEIPVQKHS